MADGQTQIDPQGVKPTRPSAPKSLGFVGSSFRVLLRQATALLGLVLILIGVPIAVMTPFPFVPIGLPIVILGVVLLGRNSLWGRNWMERVLVRHPSIEKHAPNWLMKAVFGREKHAKFSQAQAQGD